MTDRGRKPQSMEDLGRLLIGMMKRQGQVSRPALTSAGTTSGAEDIGFDNPMNDLGSLIEGGETGEAVELPIGLEGEVLTVTDVGAGELHPRWAAPTGGGGGSALAISNDGTPVDAAAELLDFIAPFLVTEPIDHQIQVDLDVGPGSGQVAAGDHDHDATYSPLVHDHDTDYNQVFTVELEDTTIETNPNSLDFSADFDVFTGPTGEVNIGLAGTSVDFSRDLQEGILFPPGQGHGVGTDETSAPSNRSQIRYLGQAPGDIQRIQVKANVSTAAVTITWAEVGIVTTDTAVLTGAAEVSLWDFDDVSAVVNSTGVKTFTFGGPGFTPVIPAGKHVWFIWGSQATTPFQLIRSLPSILSDGTTQFLGSTRPSTMTDPSPAFTVSSNQSVACYLAFQWLVVPAGGIGGGGLGLVFNVYDDDVLVDDAVEALNYGDGFILSESPSHQINVDLDLEALGDPDEFYTSPGNWLLRHKWGEVYSTPNSGTMGFYGQLTSAGTTQGSASAADDNDGNWAQFSQGTLNLMAGKNMSTQVYRPDWHLTYGTWLKTGSDVTSVRYVLGMANSAGNVNASDTPNANGAWFRFSTSAGDTNWQCVTGDGSDRTITDSGVPVTADTTYRLRVHFGTVKAKFYINEVLVATHTTNMPTSGTGLGWWAVLVNLAGAARVIKLGRVYVASVN